MFRIGGHENGVNSFFRHKNVISPLRDSSSCNLADTLILGIYNLQTFT